MSQTTKRKRARKPKKEKDSLSRQTSLWDAFGIKSSNKNTPSASAATSENESVPADDIIDICSSDAEPVPEDSSIPPASSSPYPAEGSGSTTREEHVSDGSKDVPIIIVDSSPVHSPVRPQRTLPQHPPKPLYSIFAPRKRPEERSPSQQPSTRSFTAPAAPFPDSSTQHVRGPQSTFSLPSSRPLLRTATARAQTPEAPFDFSRLSRGRTETPLHSEDPSSTSSSVDASARERCIADIPATHRGYPVLSRILAESSTSSSDGPHDTASSHLLWNDKWRPRRADQVLGNERSALYLRDWLLALKLHIARSDDALAKGKRKRGKAGETKRQIIRHVTRKRARLDSEEPQDPWEADDSTDEEVSPQPIWEVEEDFAPAQLSRLKRADTDDTIDIEESPSSQPDASQTVAADPPSQPSSDALRPFSYKPPKFGNKVFNTILLAGPSGCGKTAAVYACAEELGWDVFEVYPGIGERSGAALNKLIGDVGKNHLVTQTQQQAVPGPEPRQEKALRPKTNLFARRVVSDDEADVKPSQAPAVEDKTVEQVKPEVMSAVSQSIVLVEEVDVLYKEDANFWPALLKIINECRRPVVLTCNDISLVPFEGLPLQTTLNFTPCPPPLAVSYLQALCLAENRFLPRATLHRAYEHPDAPAEFWSDSSLHPEHIPQPTRDLRKTINHLQLGATPSAYSQTPIPSSDDQSIERLIRIARCIELSSFVDSKLRRPREELLRDHLSNNASPSPDDELGYRYLVAEPSDLDSALPITFSTYTWDEAIVDDLLSYAQAHHPFPGELRDPAPHPHPLHAAHCGAMLPILDQLRVPRELLVRDASAVFADYAPWVRHMARVDDAQIAANVASGRLEGTRRTRNSQRSQYELARWISVDETGLEYLRRTGFDVDDAPGPGIPTL